jgi:hypothetical protein
LPEAPGDRLGRPARRTRRSRGSSIVTASIGRRARSAPGTLERAVLVDDRAGRLASTRPWHALKRRPLPHGQAALRATVPPISPSCLAPGVRGARASFAEATSRSTAGSTTPPIPETSNALRNAHPQSRPRARTDSAVSRARSSAFAR